MHLSWFISTCTFSLHHLFLTFPSLYIRNSKLYSPHLLKLAMASCKLLFASLLFLSIALHLVQSHRLLESQQVLTGMSGEETKAKGTAYVTSINCGVLCGVRCSKSSRPNLCKRACGTCCARCNCVPPGTYGNYNTCPCYATMTTRGGARKCP